LLHWQYEEKAAKKTVFADNRQNRSRSRRRIVLALGAESAGNFSVLAAKTVPRAKKGQNTGKIHLSENFGDLLDDKNFVKFQKSVLNFLKKNKIKPDIILTDLHPLYKTTVWGEELAEKFSARRIKIQHHLAHIFSAIGEERRSPPANAIGIACDGTGYGTDGKIWGGECFAISNFQFPISKQITNYKLQITRIGHLENQILIGGDLAIKEPARMLLAILAGIKNYELGIKNNKEFVYRFVKKYYARNEFELLYNQMEQEFNCQETSSVGRVLDAVSVLLGFCGNERNYKHEPVDLLEKNSSLPYSDLKPKIKKYYELRTTSYELLTTPLLFEYLIENLHKDKRRLATTAQLYIAQGFYEIARRAAKNKRPKIYFGGGMANNKIMSGFFASKGAVMNKKVPRGDAGLSFGQIYFFTYLLQAQAKAKDL